MYSLADAWPIGTHAVDRPTARCVGVIGAAGMLVAATAYPLMPSATLAVAWLVVVNFFAAFPWGAINASAAEIVPASMRAQGAASNFCVSNLVAASLGPATVGALTDHLFHADSALPYSLALLNVVGMSATIALLLYAMPAYRRTIATRDDLARAHPLGQFGVARPLAVHQQSHAIDACRDPAGRQAGERQPRQRGRQLIPGN